MRTEFAIHVTKVPGTHRLLHHCESPHEDRLYKVRLRAVHLRIVAEVPEPALKQGWPQLLGLSCMRSAVELSKQPPHRS